MIGAHFDSWHTGTGATDNAVSSAVMMEAMRILQASGLKPRRTIRIALWTGEEQGLLGSRAYVKEHFADPVDMKLKPEHGKLSVYLNMDNGGGAFRGVYLQGNEAAAPVFEAWMKPFHNLGMKTLTIRNTGGTDHQAFDAVGLPGFQFIQDPLEYSSRTHHTNLDVYERAIPQDLMQNAIVVATVRLPGREPRCTVPAQAAAQGTRPAAPTTPAPRPATATYESVGSRDRDRVSGIGIAVAYRRRRVPSVDGRRAVRSHRRDERAPPPRRPFRFDACATMAARCSGNGCHAIASRATACPRPADVVRWFGAVQAQDFAGALWALGQRLDGRRTEADVLAAFDAGAPHPHPRAATDVALRCRRRICAGCWR